MGKWEIVRLGDVATITSGGTPKRDVPGYYDHGTIPWVKTGDLKTRYIYEVEDYITRDGLKNSSAKMFPAETVLIAMYGATIGACSILGIDASTNQACAAILPNDKLLNKFLYYFFASIKDELISLGVGGAQPNISGTIIKNLKIPMPPLPVQQQIADALDRASTLIEKRKAQIEKLDLLVKSQFIDMFGDPVTNPKRWEMSTIGEEIRFEGGAQPDKRYFEYKASNDNIRLIQIRDYKSDENITYIPKEKARRFCRTDDIMIGRYGPPIFQILKGIEGAYNVALIKATPIRCNVEYARRFLMQDTLLKYIEGLSQRTAGQTGIDMPKLKAYPFPLPQPRLQNQFAAFVQQVESQKSQLQQSLTKLEQNYKSLMQKCFRGEIF